MNEIPSSFTCPLTMDLMSDPVILSRTGMTYERSAIMEWLGVNNTCPSTQTKLEGLHDDIVPNIALRNAIEEWKMKNPPVVIDSVNNAMCLNFQPKKFSTTQHDLGFDEYQVLHIIYNT